MNTISRSPFRIWPSVLLLACVSFAQGDDPDGNDAPKAAPENNHKQAFKLTEDKTFRPWLVFTPPLDSQRQRPVEVAKRFVSKINEGDFAGARKDCVLDLHLNSSQLGGSGNPSVGEEGFVEFCKLVRANIAEISLATVAVNSKGEFWEVHYTAKNHNNEKLKGTLDLVQEKGRWAVLEKPHWDRVLKKLDSDAKW
ncbi:MAG: hypothetical protein JNK76_18025 [Planctomycetales bacterium]|nr:hypothetical protein [Planctomycetales bacterium]MBN8626798.1 hypothetical protein [Planctomycetota bacterium]